MAFDAEHEAARRAAYIAGLEELAALLKNHPEIPTPPYTVLYAWTRPGGDPTPLYRAAAVLGTPVMLHQSDGTYQTNATLHDTIGLRISTPALPGTRGIVEVSNPLAGDQ